MALHYILRELFSVLPVLT